MKIRPHLPILRWAAVLLTGLLLASARPVSGWAAEGAAAGFFSMDSGIFEAGFYDPSQELLILFFKNGAAREYYGVPSETVSSLRSAPFANGYFKTHIERKFPSRGLRR